MVNNERKRIMKSLKKAYCLNIVTFILILLSTIWMFSGLKITPGPSSLTTSRFGMLKYFTVDSNILMGIIALWAAFEEKSVLDGKREKVSEKLYALKLMGVVGVTLTMLVTFFFLAPTFENGWVACYNNSNFFLHAVNPIISIITFVCYERTRSLRFVHNLYGIVPMVIYAIYYVIVSVIHSENGFVLEGYDWYGFLVMGIASAAIIVPLIVLITFGISVCLYNLNKVRFAANANISDEDMAVLLKSQQGELDAVLMYQKVAEKISDESVKALILETATDEGRHASVFHKLTGVNLKPKKLKSIAVPMIMTICGKKTAFKLMANGEYKAEKNYQPVVEKYSEVLSVQQDEKLHGDRMLMISKKY